MGQWIAANDKIADEYVDSILKEIVTEIVSAFHPDSIILDGSFAHGEGTVIHTENGIKLLSDFDMLFITDEKVDRSYLKRLTTRLSEKYGTKVDIYPNRKEKYLNPSKRNPSQRTDSPSATMYSRKHGARVLHGVDYLSMMPEYCAKDIPLTEGLRLLFNRLGECLHYMRGDLLFSDDLEQDGSEELRFWTYKILISCIEAVLIENERYHFSYAQKWENFLELLALKGEGAPKILSKIRMKQSILEEAINFKLYGFSDQNLTPGELWFKSIEVWDDVFRSICLRFPGIEFDDYIEFPEQYLAKKDSLRDFRMLPFESTIIQNGYYLYVLLKNDIRPSLKLIKAINHLFPHQIHCIIPLLCFGICRDGMVRKDHIDKCALLLKPFYKQVWGNMSNIQIWNEMCEKTYRIWKLTSL